VAEEDVEVEIADNVMTISGEKKAEAEEEKEGYYYKESHSGSFSRSFTLPAEVKAEKASAEMDGGVLTVTVPKVEAKTPKKVTVKKKIKK
jgi:HSP20 family protein